MNHSTATTDEQKALNSEMFPSIQLYVDKLIYGGDGLAKVPENDIAPDKAGATVFVPMAVPGETVKARLNFFKKPFQATIEAIETLSPDRVDPECSVFGSCGGCDWQHIVPSAQRQWKEKIVAETLQRVGKLSEFNLLPILHENEWTYRNKAQWQIQPDGKLAYLSKGSQLPVVFDSCSIIAPVLQTVAKVLQGDDAKEIMVSCQFSKITAKSTVRQSVLLVLHQDETAEDADITDALMTLSALLRESGVTLDGLQVQSESRRDEASKPQAVGMPYQVEEFAGKTLQVHWQSFFQVNPQSAVAMVNCLRDWLSPLENKTHLLDAYSGVGTFAIALSDLFETVSMIESAPSAVQDATLNIQNSQHADMAIYPGLVERLLRPRRIETKSKNKPQVKMAPPEIDGLLKKPVDVTLLDPPRKGCQKEVLDWVAENTREAIVYVSCDPATLARDLAKLTEKGWRVEAVQPVDMFPQTYHIETMALLKFSK